MPKNVLVAYHLVSNKPKGGMSKSQNFVDFLVRLRSTTTTNKLIYISIKLIKNLKTFRVTHVVIMITDKQNRHIELMLNARKHLF